MREYVRVVATSADSEGFGDLTKSIHPLAKAKKKVTGYGH